jgi:hypothetical protein
MSQSGNYSSHIHTTKQPELAGHHQLQTNPFSSHPEILKTSPSLPATVPVTEKASVRI